LFAGWVEFSSVDLLLGERVVKIRWWICFLLFLTWVVSYIDRSLMPMAVPLIAQEFHMSTAAMGGVMSAFFVGYALMQIPGGFIADKIGARKSITFGMASWSVFSLLTGIVSSLGPLIWIRVGFGLSEGIHPPSTFKVLSAWFSSTERARANGLMMSSNTIGPMIAPLLFAAVVVRFGWRSAFYLVSIPGLFITALAYYYLRDDPSEFPGMSAQELAESAPGSTLTENVSIVQLFTQRVLWHLWFVYLSWDITWWGFQAWLPSYLLRERGFKLINSGAIAALPFAAGLIGVLLAGYLADRTRRHKAVLILVLLGNALFMLLTATAKNATAAVIFLTLTGFFLPAIQGPFWSLAMDLLPSGVMGRSSGFINTGGQIAGIISPIVIGALIQYTHKYAAGFVFMSISAALCAITVALLRSPKAPLPVLAMAGYE
jgi:sugar phosphate permease